MVVGSAGYCIAGQSVPRKIIMIGLQCIYTNKSWWFTVYMYNRSCWWAVLATGVLGRVDQKRKDPVFNINDLGQILKG
jgi:hypothetical protein